MIQNTSFEASDLFFYGGGGGSMPPDLSRTYEAGCGVYKFLKKSAAPPPPPFVNSSIRNWGSYTVLNIAFCLAVQHVTCLLTLNAKKLQWTIQYSPYTCCVNYF